MSAHAAKPVVRRSRAGCAECRRRRKRCDEKKPACGYCLLNDQECKYVVKLSWGGRPFSRSIFGQCLDVDDGVAKIVTQPQSTARKPFVYGIKAQPKRAKYLPSNADVSLFSSHHGHSNTLTLEIAPLDKDQDKKPASITGSDVAIFRSNVTAPRLDAYNPANYTWIPSKYRGLLRYFTQDMTRSISSYDGMQTDYCKILMPMATANPHLLAAVLYLAACHKTSRGLPQSHEETDQLRISSLQKLQLAIATSEANAVVEAAIASTLTLCIADIASEEATPGSWRIHLKGAITLWGQLIKDPKYKSRMNSESVQFLKRWYTSFESVAFGCGINPVTTYWSHFEGRTPKDEYIDDLKAFCTALLPIYEAINRLKAADNGDTINIEPRMTELKSDSITSEPYLSNVDEIDDSCQRIIRSVNELLDPKQRILRFRPGVAERIPDDVKLDYYSCDEAYHHMALLQIYTVSSSPVPAHMVRATVVSILTVIQSMTFIDGACPAVAVLPPLFVAGSQAWEKEDRSRVLNIMKRMKECWGMGNVVTSRGLLAQIWALQDERKEKGENIEAPFRWEFVTQDDILPY